MLPTHRVSHGRTRRRRSHHALTPVQSVLSPLTGQSKLPHRVGEDGYARAGLRISVPKLGIGVKKTS